MTNSTSNISLKLIPANVPSLCIPRVFSNIPRDRIFRIVEDLGLGRISSIDMVPKVSEKGEKYNRIFIHFSAWSTSKDAEKARQIALSGGEFKILYDDPYFWKISASTSIAPFVASKPATPKPAATSSRPKLAFDTLDKNQSALSALSAPPPPLPLPLPLPQQKHQYPTPESRREKYGPRPTDQRPRQEQRPRQDQRPLEQDQRPLEQDQRPRQQDPVHSPQLKEDALANVNAAANLLDKLALDMQEEPKEEPKEDIALLPPPRRRGKNIKKGVAKTVVAKEIVAKEIVAKAVAVSIEVEEGEEVEENA